MLASGACAVLAISLVGVGKITKNSKYEIMGLALVFLAVLIAQFSPE